MIPALRRPAPLFLLAAGLLAVAPAAGGDAAGSPQVTVLVAYYSLGGNTRRMAEAVAEGARAVPGAAAVAKPVDAVSGADLAGADAIVLGSPTYWGNMAAPMKAFIDDWWFKHRKVPLRDKVGAAFATGGDESGGKDEVVLSLQLAMLSAGLVVVGPLEAHFGLPGVSALSPVNEAALASSRELGRRVAAVAVRMKRGAAQRRRDRRAAMRSTSRTRRSASPTSA